MFTNIFVSKSNCDCRRSYYMYVHTVIVSTVVFVTVITTLRVSVTQLTCWNTQSITDTLERVA